GLAWPRAADLDGDGLEDLWGSVDGKLRAYRGETLEAWRVLGHYQPAGDLDGDGAGDVVTGDLRIRQSLDQDPRNNHTAIARSGRDGHVLWRWWLGDSLGFNLDNRSESGYKLSTFPGPAGDLDGDGTVDFLVRKHLAVIPPGNPPVAFLPLQALSGR